MTMMVVTHEVTFARDVADRVVFMGDGQVVESGPAQQMTGRPQHARTRACIRHVAGTSEVEVDVEPALGGRNSDKEGER